MATRKKKDLPAERELSIGGAPALWPHQEKTRAFFARRERGLDFSDAGTGKTAAQIAIYADRPKPKGRWLIICPKTLMVPAWLRDLETFAPHLTVSVADAERRLEAFQSATDVVIMNTDGTRFFDTPAKLKLLKDFDHITIDEVSYFKNMQSQRTKKLMQMRKFFRRRYAMSATPNPISVMELFAPAYFVDDGKALGASYTRLRSVCQVPTQVGPDPKMLEWNDKPGAKQAVADLLAPMTIRHDFDEVMVHVPKGHKHTIEFDLGRKAMKAYEQMARELMLAHEDSKISAVHAASLRSKLLQIASGAVYDGNGNYVVIDTGRYELIAEYMENIDHNVVFFNWKHQRDQLVEQMEKQKRSYAVIDGDVPQRLRDEIVADYQNGRYNTILLHPRTGAHGLTLTKGTTTGFSSPLYEADLMVQAMARIRRGSQTQVTHAVFFQARNTVESLVYDKLNGRAEDMAEMLRLQLDFSR